MFDRPDDTAPAHSRADTIRGVERLCDVFDRLLSDATHNLYPDQKTELYALARIFDLPTNREPGEVWAEIRNLLAPSPGEGGMRCRGFRIATLERRRVGRIG